MQFLLSYLNMLGVLGGMCFPSAGRLDLSMFWAWFGILTAAILVMCRIIDPGLRRERLDPGPGGTERNLRRWIRPLFLVHLLIAGLDLGCFHFSTTVPFALQIVELTVVGAKIK